MEEITILYSVLEGTGTPQYEVMTTLCAVLKGTDITQYETLYCGAVYKIMCCVKRHRVPLSMKLDAVEEIATLLCCVKEYRHHSI